MPTGPQITTGPAPKRTSQGRTLAEWRKDGRQVAGPPKEQALPSDAPSAPSSQTLQHWVSRRGHRFLGVVHAFRVPTERRLGWWDAETEQERQEGRPTPRCLSRSGQRGFVMP
jgi:hypothetical protein